MKGKFINKHLFALQRKSTTNLFIIFAVVISVFAVLITALYPMMVDVVAIMPDALKSMISMNTIGEYFSAEGIEFVLLLAVFAAATAVSITTNEFKNGSYELIYTLNMSRGEIVRTKLLRLVANIVYMDVINFVVILVSMFIWGAGGFSVANLIIYFLIALVVTLQVGVLIFSLGLLNKKNFNAFGAMMVVIVMYLFSVISNMADKVEWLGYLSPIASLNGSIMTEGFKGMFTNGILLGVWSLISIVLLLVSAKKFQNDDLC